MKHGVSAAQAEADVTRIYQSLATQFPADYSQPRAGVVPVRDHFLGPVRNALYILWDAVGLLLLMACANIANLLLIRASELGDEIAIRRALGVSPTRLFRQLLTEAVLLAVVGGIAGAALAWWGTSLLAAHGPAAIPRLDEVSVDSRVLLYALAISIATGMLFGLAPARLLISRTARVVTTSRRTTSGPAAWRYRATLITVNVALSAVLLVGSGLLIRSFLRLLTVEPGFDSANTLTMQLAPTGNTYQDNQGITAFYDDLTVRLQALPGVTGVTAATQLPLTDNVDRSGITVEDRPLENPASAPEADRYVALTTSRPWAFRLCEGGRSITRIERTPFPSPSSERAWRISSGPTRIRLGVASASRAAPTIRCGPSSRSSAMSVTMDCTCQRRCRFTFRTHRLTTRNPC
jgi:putative ABC transport system permease protein